MSPKSIGIIGGAGPLAGSVLFERVVRLSMQRFGCFRDADFPKILLMSFPFIEMLKPPFNAIKLRDQLRDCFKQIRANDVEIIAIACNTLHAFLDKREDPNFVHLLKVLAQEEFAQPPLVLCTSTSAALKLHKQFLDCYYPLQPMQEKVDRLIDRILKEGKSSSLLRALKGLIAQIKHKTIVLGCSELSLFSDNLSLPNKFIIDPIQIAANKIVDKSFIKFKK